MILKYQIVVLHLLFLQTTRGGNDDDDLHPLDFRPAWRTPCVLFFRCTNFDLNGKQYDEQPNINIPRSVLYAVTDIKATDSEPTLSTHF